MVALVDKDKVWCCLVYLTYLQHLNQTEVVLREEELMVT